LPGHPGEALNLKQRNKKSGRGIDARDRSRLPEVNL
jgi:hypothetical protein